ncbi:hypothetical protein D1013_00105 [Euzebyella marina]|uniref:DUF4332 domain-containing protein n=1 Tax=Euzebyella marina TaxID=1761453 RepID=A0A3G2L0V7_9FLAO|nr:hypothetical protein [Euzebyella marina]AYN65893.1 hypothetical protein D1013_00105 [Euzebyella marina]
MNFENISIWYWLIFILFGILCAFLGYCLGKRSIKAVNNVAELQMFKDRNIKLQAELDACTQKIASAPAIDDTTSFVDTSDDIPELPVLIPFNADNAKAVFGKTIQNNDLKVIEGIGPKIAGLFQTAGIATWKALSETSVASCKEVLATGGERYRIHDPSSWPMQAKMCYEGKWVELAKWQDEHDHGRL